MQGRILANRFRLEEQLGKGGMGSVWLAEHLTLRAKVAIKLMDPSIAASAQGADRFRREAQAAASLRSAHVVQVLDYGVDEGMPFLVMELLHGENLGQCLEREQRLSPKRTLEIMTQVARAVGRAHAANIVHRDLKPDNVFLVNEDGHELVKVLDFGIAKTSEPSFGGVQTRTGVTIGTPYYMSPEQAEGKKEVDHRTDLWAMTVMTSECLSGVRPFTGETWGELLLNICAREIPVPSTQGPVPPGFDAWFARGTAREIERRYASAQEFARTLSECLGGGGTVRLGTGDTSDDVEVESGVARPRSLVTPILIGLGASLLISAAVAGLGFGAWKALKGSGLLGGSAGAPPTDETPSAGGNTATNHAAGGAPKDEPTSSAGGAPGVIVPLTPGPSPFEGLILTLKGGASGRAPGEKPAPSPAPAPNPVGPADGRPANGAPRTARCFLDPFTGAIKPAKGAVPANTSVFNCKFNPFNGQYQRL